VLTPRLMLVLARGFLVVGSASLVFAAWRLFRRALAAGMPSWHLWWIIPVFFVAGAAKALFVMRKRMRQNIRRITLFEGRLWPWQLYPPPLMIFIISMVILMNILKRVLAGHGLGLGLLGGVDVALAVALAVASTEYGRPLS